MEFQPNIKAKRRCPKWRDTKPYPSDIKEKWKAVFTGFSTEVSNTDGNNFQSLYECGCLGKGTHSRGAPQNFKDHADSSDRGEFKEILVLDLEESFFLAFFAGALDIVDQENKPLTRDETFRKFETIKPNFAYTLAAYLYLKSKGWVIKSGTKFGGDFLVYKQGMRFYHASFVVVVSKGEVNLQPKDLQGMQRVAETSDKDILFLSVHASSETPTSELCNYIHTFKVTETIPRRFDLKKHVQNKQNST